MTEHTADRQLRERARAVIPGGMYGHQSAPGAAYPQFMHGGRGARIWDVDGNEYVDLMCSYGPVVLGHQHPAVEAAAAAQAALGDCQNGPGPVMVDLAELLVQTVRHADWAMFAKNGTDATTMCCTIARAQTGRRQILAAAGAYHGAAPWCTPRLAGTSPEDRAHLGYYTFNDLASVRRAAAEAGDDLAAILVSPFKHDAGYDSELVDPAFARFSVPRGVLWAVGSSAVLGMIALIGFTVAIPDLKTVESAPLPLLAIAGYWLPSWLVKVFVAFVVFSMFAILVVGSGAQARLVYSLSRDNMLPFSGVLRKINPRSQTPIIALLVLAVIDVGVMIYGYFQTSAFGTLVGATAIIPYIIYFLITLAYAIKRRTTDSIPGAFNLGRWAWPVIGFVLAYTVLIMLVLSLPAPFHGADKVLGYGLALAALWYFGGLVWRLKNGTAGVKPVEDLIAPPPARQP